MQTDVLAWLADHQIRYDQYDHPPAHTSAELEALQLPGLNCKNLFLRDQKKQRYFLVVLPASHRTDMAALAAVVGEKKLSFVNEETLLLRLGVTPGAVGVFGLLNNAGRDVEVYIHAAVGTAEQVYFHPNRNDASLVLSRQMFRNYLRTLPHTINWFD